MNGLSIKCFGISRDITGKDEIIVPSVELNIRVEELKKSLNKKYPALNKINSYFIAVNQEFGADDDIVNSSDELAIIPPLSGG